jgi:two-component system, chemotaxis family, chemotaxis protein CheY
VSLQQKTNDREQPVAVIRGWDRTHPERRGNFSEASAQFFLSGILKKEGDNVMEHNNKKRVLVVDDDSELRYVLSVRLVSAGYTVYGAANGLEALEQLEKHSIDVVVTDYRMPKMDGLEFLSIARVKWPEIPVVVLSGERDDMAHEAIDRGAYAWVRKGSGFTTLLEIIASAVQQSVHA